MLVAVIGPANLVHSIMEAGQQYPGLNLIPLIYQQEEEASELALRYRGQVEAFLFAGRIPYEIVSRQFRDVPMVYIHHTSSGLYKVLFQVMRDSEVATSFCPCISVDVLHLNEIQTTMEDIGMQVDKLYVKEYLAGQNTDMLVQFHYELWQQRKVNYALTCVSSVYDRLQALGVKCYRVSPTRSIIADALKRVQLERKNWEVGSTQLAVFMVRLNELTDGRAGNADSGSERPDISAILSHFSGQAKTWMYWSDRDTTTFVTTRGAIEALTRNFSLSPLPKLVNLAPGWSVCQGIGIGWTANDAELHAKDALVKAAMEIDACYAVLENRTILGPLGKNTQLAYSSRSQDPIRLAMAKRIGLSIGTLNKLMALQGQIAKPSLTALELASWFGITLRSARRLLSLLINHDLASVVGEEQPINKGRPRQVYALRFPAEAGEQAAALAMDSKMKETVLQCMM
jgi:hypothetical protein